MQQQAQQLEFPFMRDVKKEDRKQKKDGQRNYKEPPPATWGSDESLRAKLLKVKEGLPK